MKIKIKQIKKIAEPSKHLSRKTVTIIMKVSIPSSQPAAT